MTDKGRNLLSVVCLIAAVAAAWVYVLAPKRELAVALKTQVVAAEQQRNAALARAAEADRARATYDSDYATVARLGKAVPVTADVPSLVYQLETAARAAKVDFRSVSVLDTTPEPAAAADAAATPAKSGGGIVPAPFSFKFEGSYFGLQKMLAAVDRFSRVKGTQIKVNGRLLTIDGVTLSPGRKGLPQVRGVVTARAYVAAMPDALPAGTDAASSATSIRASGETTP